MQKPLKARIVRDGWTFNEAQCRWDRNAPPVAVQPAPAQLPAKLSPEAMRIALQAAARLETVLRTQVAATADDNPADGTPATQAKPAKPATPARIDELLKLTPLGRQAQKQSMPPKK